MPFTKRIRMLKHERSKNQYGYLCIPDYETQIWIIAVFFWNFPKPHTQWNRKFNTRLHPLWETIKVEKFHYITNHIPKWIEIHSEVAFLFSYAPTFPLYFESIIHFLSDLNKSMLKTHFDENKYANSDRIFIHTETNNTQFTKKPLPINPEHTHFIYRYTLTN